MPRKKLSQMSYEEREAHYKSLIKEFTIFDDVFMKVVLDDEECIEYILKIILAKQDLKVIHKDVQASHVNLCRRSIIMDCLAVDDTGKKYDIEIQRDSRGAGARRARYHSSLLDAKSLMVGDDFDSLPECYVIFITEDDVIGDGEPIYHMERCARETGKSFDDGSHIIYVDSSKQDDTELGKLMQDLHCKNPNEFHSDILGQRVRELKETQEGVKDMCQALQELIDYNSSDWFKEGERKGIARGKAEGMMTMAQNLYRKGNDIDFIASVAEVPTSVVQEWVGAPTA